MVSTIERDGKKWDLVVTDVTQDIKEKVIVKLKEIGDKETLAKIEKE